ncbi:hypothetical protein KO317_01090 [Candidatus Micrarchaeota archaeon]|nr:hypothetical protein [Candidatus Micrarchaeota archaeon]
MKITTMILFMAIICGSIYSLTLEQIIFSYLETGETFRYETITCENQDYNIVISGGKELFIFEKTNDRYYFIKDKEKIKDILMCYYINHKNLTIEGQFDRLNEAKENVEKFFESRGTQEDKCKQYTGIDRLSCIDQTSCLVACRTVYICDTYSFGIGMDFIDLILSYNTNTKKLDEFEEEYMEIFNDAIKKQDLASLDELDNYFLEISKAGKEVESNELITMYYFCPEVKYKTSELTSAKSIISNIRKSIAPLYEIDNTVNRMYSETNSRKADYIMPKGDLQVLMFNNQIINTAYFKR